MCAKADTAGKGRRDKRFFKNRIQYGEHGMVQNPVTDGSFMDMPLFRIADIKAAVRPVPVGPVPQIPIKLKDIGFQMPLKQAHISFISLTLFELLPSCKQVLRRNNFPKKVAINFH